MRHSPRVAAVLPLLVVLAACSDDDPTGPEDFECGDSPVLTLGTPTTGTLQSGDDLDVDGAYLDRYSLVLEAATVIQIDMESDAVDAFLWLRTEGGSMIELNDDGGNDLNARIVESLQAGCFIVDATSADPDDVGGYTLLVAAQI
jgi:hypothetical protein